MSNEKDLEVFKLGMDAYEKNERNEWALREIKKLVDDFYENSYWGELNINIREGAIKSVIQSIRTKI